MEEGQVAFLNNETRSQFICLQNQISAVQKELGTAQLTWLFLDFDFMCLDDGFNLNTYFVSE